MERIGEIIGQGNFPKTTGTQTKSSEVRVPDRDTIESCEEQKAECGYAPNPHCAACRGFGYVHPLLDNGRPDYSRVVNCHAKGCLSNQKRLYETTEPCIKEKGVSKFHTFDNWKPVLGAETTLDAFRDIAFNEGAPPLLLVYGTTGSGKSHLCEATVTELSRRGIDCRLWVVPDLVSKLKESIPENTTELLMDKMKALPALILDEWGQNYGSAWEEQKLEEIVLAREREGLITIITSNLEPDKLPERITSRFRDKSQARMIANKALDYRPKKKAKK